MNTINKKLYIEILRIIAAFLVIFNHLPGYSLYYVSDGWQQGFYMVLAMITRINVPIFFMISGSLLLKKEEDVLCILKRRFLRIVLVLFTFELIMCSENMLLGYRKTGEIAFSLKAFLLSFFSGTVSGTGSYWYLYAYIGMLLLLPFLRSITKSMTKKQFMLLLGLHFCTSSLLPFINLIGLLFEPSWTVLLEAHFAIPIATEKALFYPLVGYYIDNIELNVISREKSIFMFIATCLCIGIECFCTYLFYGISGEMNQNYTQMFDYFISITVFIFVKKLFINRSSQNKKIDNCITTFGEATLVIYLLDQFYKYLIYGRYEKWAESIFPTLIVSLGWCIISMILGTISSLILKKLPYFRRIV